MKVSVIVPTKDRGPAISETLDSLLRLEFPAGEYEIVVVDNCSAVEYRRLLEEYQKSFGGRIRCVREEELGLSHARNCGIRNSTGDVIAFTDDDAVVPPYWLAHLVKPFHDDPGVFAVGGKVVARFTTPPPDWLDGRLAKYISSFDKGDHQMLLEYNEYPRGVNMAFRREAFEECGMFLRCLGRKGASLLSYEEIEICYRISRAGHKVAYAPYAEVYHLIRGDRLSRDWFAKRFYWQGRSEGLFELIHFGKRHVLGAFWRHVVLSVRGDALDRRYHRGFLASTALGVMRRRFV